MIKISHTEESYLRAIYQLTEQQKKKISTNDLALIFQVTPAAISDMLKKIADKSLIVYKKYYGVVLSKKGEKEALKVIRRHRLWKVFLVEKLNFSWNEIQAISIQLGHIQSLVLTARLENFLGHPRYDPHGYSIPDEQGNIHKINRKKLSQLEEKEYGIIDHVEDHQETLLQYLQKRNINLGTKVQVIEKVVFDNSMEININNSTKLNISKKVADAILIIAPSLKE